MNSRHEVTPIKEPASPAIWQRYGTTCGLVVINLVVAAGMRLSASEPSNSRLLKWGADWGPLSLGGQFWRTFTSMFVHDGFHHLIMNMLVLLVIGRVAERMFGHYVYLALYICCGLSGNALSLALYPDLITCGASGAILGTIAALIGALSVKILRQRNMKSGTTLWLLFAFFAYWLFAGWYNPHVDNACHYGAAVAGLLLGSVLIVEPNIVRVRRLTFGLTALFLVAELAVIRHSNRYIVPLALADRALIAGNLSEARSAATTVLLHKPNDVLANVELGDICLKMNDCTCAQSALRSALAADRDNNNAEYLQGVLYLRLGQPDKALVSVTNLFRRGVVGDEEQVLFAAAIDKKGEHVLAGEQYLSIKRVDDAINAFQAAIALNPHDQEALDGLASAKRLKAMNEHK